MTANHSWCACSLFTTAGGPADTTGTSKDTVFEFLATSQVPVNAVVRLLTMCACCQVAESELSAWAQRGYACKKSKQRGKPAWVVQCHRKIIGTCRVGDIVAVVRKGDSDRPMPPKGVAGSSAQAGSTPAVGSSNHIEVR